MCALCIVFNKTCFIREKAIENLHKPGEQKEKLVWKIILYFFNCTKATKLDSLRKFLPYSGLFSEHRCKFLKTVTCTSISINENRRNRRAMTSVSAWAPWSWSTDSILIFLKPIIKFRFWFGSVYLVYTWHPNKIDDLQNYCLGTRRGIAADRGRPAVGFVYISNGKLVHFIFSLWPFSS